MVLGSWQPVLSADMDKLNFTQIGIIYGLLPFAWIITPFIGGQLGDRYVNTEKLLGIIYILSALLLFIMAKTTSFNSLLPLMFLWALVYAPTTALINSITFHHLPGAEIKFSLVRVFGTFGWIAAGLLLTGLRNIWPEKQGLLWLGGNDSLWLGGFISFLLGLFCFKLPCTPPIKTEERPWALLSVLKMLREPSTTFFIVILFIMSTAVMFYTVLTAPFLRSIGIQRANVPAVMTIAQFTEIGVMFVLPLMLKRWGVYKTMVLGILAWLIRYALFASILQTWLVIIALSLHGLCFVCFNIVSYIYINSIATSDIRASAQASVIFAFGAGRGIGSIFTGWITDYYVTNSPNTHMAKYNEVFIVPLGLTALCLILFLLIFFKTNKMDRLSSKEQSDKENGS